MAGERLITFNAYYLLIFQISLIILIILPRQLFSQQVTFFGRLSFLFLWYIPCFEYFPLFEKKKEKKERNPEVKIQLLKRKQRWRILITWHFSACYCHSFFFESLLFQAPSLVKGSLKQYEGSETYCAILWRVLFDFISILHISQTVFMQIAKGKKKKKRRKRCLWPLLLTRKHWLIWSARRLIYKFMTLISVFLQAIWSRRGEQ